MRLKAVQAKIRVMQSWEAARKEVQAKVASLFGCEAERSKVAKSQSVDVRLKEAQALSLIHI